MVASRVGEIRLLFFAKQNSVSPRPLTKMQPWCLHSIRMTLIMASCIAVRPFGMRAFRPLRRRPSSLHLTAYDLCTQSRSLISLSGIQYGFHRILNNVLPSDSRMSVAVSTCDKRLLSHSACFWKGMAGDWKDSGNESLGHRIFHGHQEHQSRQTASRYLRSEAAIRSAHGDSRTGVRTRRQNPRSRPLERQSDLYDDACHSPQPCVLVCLEGRQCHVRKSLVLRFPCRSKAAVQPCPRGW